MNQELRGLFPPPNLDLHKDSSIAVLHIDSISETFWGVRAVARNGSKVESVTFTAIKRAIELRLWPFQVCNVA